MLYSVLHTLCNCIRYSILFGLLFFKRSARLGYIVFHIYIPLTVLFDFDNVD